MPARNPYLDAIRATAILLVVFHHLADVVRMPAWLALPMVRGYIGVDLFFVLSGWLIGGQLFRAEQRSGSVDLGRFWLRRWARPLPAYYAVLVVLWALEFVDTSAWAIAPSIATIPELFFTQNYTSPRTFALSWSLCVEEHFYLALPLVLLAVRRWPRLMLPMSVFFLLVSPLARWLAWGGTTQGTRDGYISSIYVPTHMRLDGLVLGVLAAAAKERRTAAWAWCARHARALAWAGLLVLLASSYNPWAFDWTDNDKMSWFGSVPGYLGVSVGVAMMLPAADAPRAAATRWWPGVATWIAEHAYALYLLHLTAFAVVLQGCIAWNVHTEWVVVVLMLAGTLAASWALRAFVEKPGLALRDRWEARRAAAPDAALGVSP